MGPQTQVEMQPTAPPAAPQSPPPTYVPVVPSQNEGQHTAGPNDVAPIEPAADPLRHARSGEIKSESLQFQPIQPTNQGPNYDRVLDLTALSGDQPQTIDCPHCKIRTKTRIQQDNSSMTMLWGVLLGLCCICLACLPCMMGVAQDVTYRCSNCNEPLAHRKHDSPVTTVIERPRPVQQPTIYTSAPAREMGAQEMGKSG